MSNLLIYRFVLFNLLVGVAVAGLATRAPLIEMVVTDSTFICALIVALFVVGFLGVTKEVIVATRMRNGSVPPPKGGRDKDLEKVAWLEDVSEWLVRLGLIGTVIGFSVPPPKGGRDKDLEKVAWLEDVSEWLVRLGLIGTVIGFAIALTGVAASNVSTVDGAKETVIALMNGMRVAIDTTILGAATALWHGINVRMLRTALISYWADVENRATYWI